MFASELAKPTSICLGAFDGSDLVGYVITSRYVDAWHVMNVAVHPEHQRRGVATALLERLFELTRDDERRGYTLEVRISNDGAVRLYEQLGFEPRGVRRGYYTDNREDALIMWRDAGHRAEWPEWLVSVASALIPVAFSGPTPGTDSSSACDAERTFRSVPKASEQITRCRYGDASCCRQCLLRRRV